MNARELRLAYEKHWFDYGHANGTPDFDQWKLGIAFPTDPPAPIPYF